jgi:hypothetical protein
MGTEKVNPFSTKVETGSTDFGENGQFNVIFFEQHKLTVQRKHHLRVSRRPRLLRHRLLARYNYAPQGFTEASGTDEAFNRAVQVGAIVALTAWDLLTDNAFFELKKEWRVKLAKNLSM